MDTEKIANLASAAHDARQLFQNLGMLNVKHDPEENRRQMINYELAKAAMFEADLNLRKAQGL